MTEGGYETECRASGLVERLRSKANALESDKGAFFADEIASEFLLAAHRIEQDIARLERLAAVLRKARRRFISWSATEILNDRENVSFKIDGWVTEIEEALASI